MNQWAFKILTGTLSKVEVKDFTPEDFKCVDLSEKFNEIKQLIGHYNAQAEGAIYFDVEYDNETFEVYKYTPITQADLDAEFNAFYSVQDDVTLKN